MINYITYIFDIKIILTYTTIVKNFMEYIVY